MGAQLDQACEDVNVSFTAVKVSLSCTRCQKATTVRLSRETQTSGSRQMSSGELNALRVYSLVNINRAPSFTTARSGLLSHDETTGAKRPDAGAFMVLKGFSGGLTILH